MQFDLKITDDGVDFWSDVRLPYEPRGSAKEARDQLRAALVSLAPTGRLSATYTAAPSGFCDLENVLTYNVGPGAFARLAEHGLRLVRRFDAPGPAPSGFTAHHHHRYTTTVPESSGRQACTLVGERRFLLPTPLDKSEPVWVAARRAADAQQHASGPRTTLGALGLAVEVELPRRSPLRLHSMLKVLLDGIVCSFHKHDGPDDMEALIARVEAKLNGTVCKDEIKQLLTAGPAELGTRRLLHSRGGGVQWNPADDELVVIDARLARSDTVTPMCRAKLVEVTPAVAVRA